MSVVTGPAIEVMPLSPSYDRDAMGKIVSGSHLKQSSDRSPCDFCLRRFFAALVRSTLVCFASGSSLEFQVDVGHRMVCYNPDSFLVP